MIIFLTDVNVCLINTCGTQLEVRYSLQETKVLGKLACFVLAKILGIGTAEQNWKQVNYIKSGLRNHTDTDRVKKQAALYGQYRQVKARVKQTKQ